MSGNTTPSTGRTVQLGWRRPLLVVHIAAGVGALGVDLVLLTLGLSGANGSDPRTVYPAAHLIGEAVLLPLAALSVLSGIVLATAGGWGLFRHGWVTTKLIVGVVLFVVVVVVLVPGLGRAAHDATATPPQVLTSGQKLPFALAPIGATVLLVLNLALGVYKPGRRSATRPAAMSARTPSAVA